MFDYNTDYQALINAEKAKGSMANLATVQQLEQSRNEKIKMGQQNGLTSGRYAQTHDYTIPTVTPMYDNIRDMYSAQQQSALAKLKSAYDQNTADLDSAAEKIPTYYNTARNSAAASSAQNQASFNEASAASGLNSGAGGQASLAAANTLAGNLSSLDREQAGKLADIETQRTKLAAQYNDAIQEAIANNDTEKAQALYSEAVRIDNSLISNAEAQQSMNMQYQQMYNSQDQFNKQFQTSQDLARAQILAAKGDYTGYEALYGISEEDADKLFKIWKAENPNAAKALLS